MGIKSTDRGVKGIGNNKILDGYLIQFFNTDRTGGGGGGCGQSNYSSWPVSSRGGNGGSGIVLIAYPS